MKKIAMALLFSLIAFSAFSSDVIRASKDENLKIMDSIVGVKLTYSNTSKLEAKVVELLAGDGMNPTRMVLILGTGNPMVENRIFELGKMMVEATRITFLEKDLVVINYTQDDFDQNGNTILAKRSMKIEVLRNDKGELSGKIKILK